MHQQHEIEKTDCNIGKRSPLSVVSWPAEVEEVKVMGVVVEAVAAQEEAVVVEAARIRVIVPPTPRACAALSDTMYSTTDQEAQQIR